ncbi:hypothetical protein F444_09393 [Phytophthora nicotianae P1976]|nr:hypothetical protein F444_09393 [Phytophthora nicotianae P1976]
MREVCLSAMSEESVQAFLDMLKANNKLEYLELLVSPALVYRYAAAFRQHHRETHNIEGKKVTIANTQLEFSISFTTKLINKSVTSVYQQPRHHSANLPVWREQAGQGPHGHGLKPAAL